MDGHGETEISHESWFGVMQLKRVGGLLLATQLENIF